MKFIRTAILFAALTAVACGGGGSDGNNGADGADGTDGAAGAPGAPGSDGGGILTRFDDLPETTVEILSVGGGTGPGGVLQVGDTISVTFTVKRGDGRSLSLASLDAGSIYVSGPVTNYQRVMVRERDLIAASMTNADGSYTYTFGSAIPAVYPAPYNDTPSFDENHLEWTGQPLVDGTYSVGIEAYKFYDIGGSSFRDSGNAVFDFLFGGATVLEHRELIVQENCNQCHTNFRIHGSIRKDMRLCALCHTAGAEDRNTGGTTTPDTSIDFRVMVHKIHAGRNLPSVLGVGTNPDGSRDYTRTPMEYKLVGFGTLDATHFVFPVFPNLASAMPRDMGYSSLTDDEQDLEDEMRSGPTDCAKCHGDPDGSGPLEAPAQGDTVYTTGASRIACGSCHDDIDWDRPYTANGFTMPPQTNDNLCNACHGTFGPVDFDARLGHIHPLTDPALTPGLRFEILSVNGGAAVNPGDKVSISFTIKDAAGTTLPPTAFSNFTAVLSGPTQNMNLVMYNDSIPTSALGAGPTHTINVPDIALYEYVGDAADDGSIESFSTMRAPHWHSFGADTTVWQRTDTDDETDLTADAPAGQNYVEVDDSSIFEEEDIVVIDDGNGNEEYREVLSVVDDRVYFWTPRSYAVKAGLTKAHSDGATIKLVELTELTMGTDYTLSESTGTIMETGASSFGEGNAIVVSYTADFVMPDVFPMPFNGSDDLDETVGKWQGKPIADGTYTIGIYGRQTTTVSLHGETNSYRAASPAFNKNFLVGGATSLTPYTLISSGENCESCHNDIRFHGSGRRGFDACLLCHGTEGAEDRPQYITASSAATIGESINFRAMLHKIHMGKELTNASTYTVVGFRGTPHMYSEVGFPALPGGVKNCAACHGSSNAWQEPGDRNHPTDQGLPAREWATSCLSCHDSTAAAAHAELQTTLGGVESCAVCHQPGRDYSVEVSHKPR